MSKCSNNSGKSSGGILHRANVWTTFSGLLGGMVITCMVYLLMVTQLNYTIIKATWICSFLAIILPLGLAFNIHIQCVTFLTIPQFCSKRGRSLIIAYAFVLTICGPAANTMTNIKVISVSLSCGQEQLKSTFQELLRIIKEPFIALKSAIKDALKSIEIAFTSFKKLLIRIKELVKNILNCIKSAFNFLASAVNICNKKVGTPFQRCAHLFDNAIEDCKEKLGVFSPLCNITYIVKALCYAVKFLDFVCMLLDFINDAIISVVTNSLNKFIREIERMFYVSVDFQHSFHFKTNTSKTLNEIKDDIAMEVNDRSNEFIFLFKSIKFLSSLFFLWMILKILRYRRNYLKRDRFENNFITSAFFNIDRVRVDTGHESLLPLKTRENRKYIKLSSIILTRNESIHIIRSSIFLFISSIQILSILLADYSIFWVLATIRFYGRKEAAMDVPPMVTLNVAGGGIVADLIRSIVNVFEPMGKAYNIDSLPCLPDPSPPNINKYIEIGTCLIFCWVVLFFEPYALRLRQIILNKFYPFRERQRAAWLYNHIMSRRMNFLKFARRAARRKFSKSKSDKNMQIRFMDMISAKCDNIWLLRKILGESKRVFCMLCGNPLTPPKPTKPSSPENDIFHCRKIGCSATYCSDCFSELKNKCSICMEPMEYGDFSDISEEIDSSEDNVYGKNIHFNDRLALAQKSNQIKNEGKSGDKHIVWNI